MRTLSLCLLTTLLTTSTFAGVITKRSVADGDLYIISIGINDYSQTYLKTIYKGCEDDALRVHRMFSEDYLELPPSVDKDHGIIQPYLLLGESADYEGIKSAFKTVF